MHNSGGGGAIGIVEMKGNISISEVYVKEDVTFTYGKAFSCGGFIGEIAYNYNFTLSISNSYTRASISNISKNELGYNTGIIFDFFFFFLTFQ